MSLLIVFVTVILMGALWARRRRKQKSVYKSGQKHPTGFFKYHKETRTELKKRLSDQASDDESSLAVAVLTFKGDLRASENSSFSRLVDEVCLNKERLSEIVLLIESPGGSVTDYGYSYSQVARLRELNVPLTVCIDTVAASGGYLMAIPAHKIVAAPFAMVGSIGVVSFVPNIRKLLQRLDIEPRTFTAGNYKRTVTLTDEATPEQIKHYEEQLEMIHEQFKSSVITFRPRLDAERVSSGDAWLAQKSMDLKLGLVDELGTSSAYLFNLNQCRDLVFFNEKKSKKGLQRLLSPWVDETLFESILERFISRPTTNVL